MAILSFDLQADLDFQPIRINVSNGTTTPQEEQLCQIILKSMHKCRRYGPDKSIRTHIHLTKFVTAMSRFIVRGLDKNDMKDHRDLITYLACSNKLSAPC